MDRLILKHLLALAAAATLAACGGEGGEPVPEPVGDDPYADAIPDEQMLALGEEEEGQGLTQGLESGPAGFQQVGREVMGGVNGLLRDTHRGLRQFALAAPHVDFQKDGADCRLWAAAHEGTEWQLISCEEDRLAHRFGFLLRGRPVGSTGDEGWLPVFAGKGRGLPRFEGLRRGAGIIGYDFDNLATLQGELGGAQRLTGRLAVGYRAAGRARQLVVALDHVQGDDGLMTAVFRYAHIRGLGGKFSWITVGDFLGTDPVTGEIGDGSDGLEEIGRAAIAWNSSGAARTVYVVCGGTLGNACFRAAQCWAPDGVATHEEVGQDVSVEPTWSETACGATVFDPAAPDEEDAAPATGGGENGAPDVLEPGPIPEEQE